MRYLDFLVNTDQKRTLNAPQAVETGLLRANITAQNGDQIKSRYDVLFTPGNSFGHMTGGFDLAVVDVFGREIQTKVLRMIREKYAGMMPVGAAEVVVHDERAVVYVPTMFAPTSNVDPIAPYMAMHNALRALTEYEEDNNAYFDRALVPLFCTGTANIPHEVALFQQNEALVEFQRARHQEDLGCLHLFDDGMARYNALIQPR
jgi:O-acetyl-ADP-ribose deacetylase (regulator of RNase III)